MNPYLLLISEALISITVSAVVLYILSAPLMNVLDRICPGTEAAAFWLSYTKVMLIIAPLLLVLTVDLLSNFTNPMETLRLALMAALGGILLGLFSMGKRLGQFVKVPQK